MRSVRPSSKSGARSEEWLLSRREKEIVQLVAQGSSLPTGSPTPLLASTLASAERHKIRDARLSATISIRIVDRCSDPKRVLLGLVSSSRLKARICSWLDSFHAVCRVSQNAPIKSARIRVRTTRSIWNYLHLSRIGYRRGSVQACPD